MRRGSGINKGTDPEQSAKRVKRGSGGFQGVQVRWAIREKARMRGGVQGQGVQGCLGGVQGVPGAAQGGSRGKTAKKRKNQKNAPELSGSPATQQHPGFCAGGSSRPNGSVYPLPCQPPKCPTRHPGLADTYIHMYIHIYS